MTKFTKMKWPKQLQFCSCFCGCTVRGSTKKIHSIEDLCDGAEGGDQLELLGRENDGYAKRSKFVYFDSKPNISKTVLRIFGQPRNTQIRNSVIQEALTDKIPVQKEDKNEKNNSYREELMITDVTEASELDNDNSCKLLETDNDYSCKLMEIQSFCEDYGRKQKSQLYKDEIDGLNCESCQIMREAERCCRKQNSDVSIEETFCNGIEEVQHELAVVYVGEDCKDEIAEESMVSPMIKSIELYELDEQQYAVVSEVLVDFMADGGAYSTGDDT